MARRQIATLPRERAAAIAREMVNLETELGRQAVAAGDPNAWSSNLKAFITEYAGTETALLAEVDLLTHRPDPQTLGALDAFVQAHPGTNAAAKALYRKGSHLGMNGFSFGERPGHDPTDRFFRVLDVYKELRSGRYPPSEWVEKAPSLIIEFSTFKPSYAAGNVDRIVRVYEEFLPPLLSSPTRMIRRGTGSFS